ncbi:MAG: hypothetical protein PHC69_09715 [Ruminiclostridium sp.]|nr:hypothetical protein [Ruminiclostridium sp.]
MQSVNVKVPYYYGRAWLRNSVPAAKNLNTGKVGPLYFYEIPSLEEGYREYYENMVNNEDIKTASITREKIMKIFLVEHRTSFMSRQSLGEIDNYGATLFVKEPIYRKELDYTFCGEILVFYLPKTSLVIDSDQNYTLNLLAIDGKELSRIQTSYKANKNEAELIYAMKNELYLPLERCELKCNGVQVEYLRHLTGLGNYYIICENGKKVSAPNLQKLFFES